MDSHLFPNTENRQLRYPSPSTHKYSTIGIFETHDLAEETILQLETSGVDMHENISLIGKDYSTQEHIIGYYNTNKQVQYWGKLGDFWSSQWAKLNSSAFIIVPGVGHILMAGPIIDMVLTGVDKSPDKYSPVGIALHSIGIPRQTVIRYETAIKANKFLVLAHGDQGETHRAQEIFHHCHGRSIASYTKAGMAHH